MQTEAYIRSLQSSPFHLDNDLRIIIAGGGTGGHIFPAVAIAKELQRQYPGVQLLFVGAKGKMEMEKVPQEGFNIVGLYIAGYSRSSLLKNLTLPFKLARSFYQVRKILNGFKPQAVIGVGGYSSFPVLRLAQTRNIPTFIHESNSYPGRSNILLAKKASKIFVATYGMDKYFPADKILMTGNPVRKVLLEEPEPRASALKYFGLEADKKTVLVVGGSLGAKSLNEVISKNIAFFKDNSLQLIWQTGKEYATTAASIEEESKNIWTGAFISKMETAYAAADFVISRSGAMAVAELCIVAKPVIFVPYPHAAEDHQTANAMALVHQDAALLVKDSDVEVTLMPAIKRLISDTALTEKLQSNIKVFANTKADELIASEILKCLHV